MENIDVELANVTKRFGAVTAVSDVSFQVKKGEFFSLLGPSGCGKTTIMRMISGFEQPTEGVVHIAGKDVTSAKPYERPTNLVFQHLALFPHLTIAENIAFGLNIKKLPKPDIQKRVGDMLDLVRLPGLGDRKINQLSGGQKQRIAIARALVNQPEVLLLDEPLGALDLKLREQMQLELKRIQNEIGTTFIYVTHDQKEAITMSDVIAVVNKGRIEQMGSATAIYERPETSFVAGFIGETNLLEGVISQVNGTAATVMVGNLAINVELPAPAAVGAKIHVSIRPEKIVFNGAMQEGWNTYDATVDEAIYMGNYTHYRVRLSADQTLGVDVPNATAQGVLDVGTPVKIGWHPALGVPILEGMA